MDRLPFEGRSGHFHGAFSSNLQHSRKLFAFSANMLRFDFMSSAIARAGHFRYFLIFLITKNDLAFFLKVGVGFLNRTGAEICYLHKKCKKIIITEKIIKYR